MTTSRRHARRTHLRRRRLLAGTAALAGVGLVGAGAVAFWPDDDGAAGAPGAAGTSTTADDGDPAPTADATGGNAGTDDGQGTSGAPDGDDAGGEAEDVVVTILSAGDVLPHATVNRTAQTADGSYDFVPLMAGTEEWTAGADLALCSMEVPLAPPGEPVSAYPLFGAPEELVAGLAELGWDGCNLATNHSMDRGLDGLVHTLDVFDEEGLGHVGTARSPEEAAAPQMYRLERAGREIVVAHLSATTIDNGLPAPESAPWAVTKADTDALTEQAAAARAAGADIVVASVHWGVEYVHAPVEEQLSIANALAEGGEIDLVYGNHSHTPQPLERLDGGPDGTGMWVAWSMGNFISNQDSACCTMETATGVMVTATVTAPADEPARVTDLDWTAVTVDRQGDQRNHPLHELVAGARPEALTLDDATIAARAARVAEVMGGEERTEAPTPTGPEPEVLPR